MAAVSVFPLKSALGMCSFSLRTMSFRLVPGWNVTNDYAALYQVVEECEAECILCPAAIRDAVEAATQGVEIQTAPASAFHYEEGKSILISLLQLASDLMFETRFSSDLRAAVSALPPLYQYALTKAQGPFGCEVGGERFLCSDLETIRNLQIIKDDFHPSMIKSAGRTKEGFSVFSLLDKTVTRQGRRVLRQWVLQPLQSLSAISSRQQQVEFFAMNPVTAVELHRCLRSISDLEKLIARFRSYSEKPTDWGKLLKSIKAWEAAYRLIASDPMVERALGRLPEVKLEEMQSLARTIETSFDFSHCGTARPPIRPGISQELDYTKQLYENLECVLTHLAEVEAADISPGKSHISVVYFPQLGYLVELKAPQSAFSSSASSPDELLDTLRKLGYEFQFRTEESVYYKSCRCKELDEKFGDVVSVMRDAEGAEVRKLQEEVRAAAHAIVRVSRFVGEVDAIISLATAAGMYNWSRPQVSEHPGIEIVNGRHPLVELCVPHFIPNDCELTPSQRLGVITGPNSSGKSVYLKMIGIIVYLAHCGSFVPAENAVVALCDRLYTRMNVRDSRNSSAFTQELKRLSLAVSDATSRSLLLLDELGKNTATEDGMALVYGTLSYFARHSTPFCLLSTHYRELVTLGVLRESETLRFFSMEMRESDEPVFLYKLVPGVPQSSLAFHCAKLAGVPEAIVNRGLEVRRKMRTAGERL